MFVTLQMCTQKTHIRQIIWFWLCCFISVNSHVKMFYYSDTPERFCGHFVKGDDFFRSEVDSLDLALETFQKSRLLL